MEDCFGKQRLGRGSLGERGSCHRDCPKRLPVFGKMDAEEIVYIFPLYLSTSLFGHLSDYTSGQQMKS
jgi:hypothetical protein